jgi:hypothetical protein
VTPSQRPVLISHGFEYLDISWLRSQLWRSDWYVLTYLDSLVNVNEDTGLRFLLGLAEAGLLPGIIFYLSW